MLKEWKNLDSRKPKSLHRNPSFLTRYLRYTLLVPCDSGIPFSRDDFICFLSFRLGKSLALPGMIFPGWQQWKRTRATNIGSESKTY